MTYGQFEPIVDAWKRRARESGKYIARERACWVTDGNESDESRRQKLKLIEDGDPRMDDVLPKHPNLSEDLFADSLDPETLIEEVTDLKSSDVPYEVREEVIHAWEEAVNEEFTLACERELRRWL